MRPSGGRSASGHRRVLIVEDDAELGRALKRGLDAAGYDATHVLRGGEAAELVMRHSFDAVLSDIQLPEVSGIDLLRMVRAYGVDIPVILMTANPSVETAVEAMDLGAVKYLRKPVAIGNVLAAVHAAFHSPSAVLRAVQSIEVLTARFDRALEELWIAFQPIADARDRRLLGYEAFVRSREPTLATPADLFTAAEQLGRVGEVGERARALAARSFASLSDERLLLFLNVNAADLESRSLYGDESVLAPLAGRVVLEICDCSALGTLAELRTRISVLRLYGFQVALGNIGSGYPGLDGLVDLEPDIVKLAMGIVRNVDESRSRQEVVRSMARLADTLSFKLVAEGVETEAELQAVRRNGCRYVQGFHLGAPRASFGPRRSVA